MTVLVEGVMNGRTQAYLDLSAMPPVGGLMLDGRPAFVFRGDGSAILWANAAGVAFFGAPDLAQLLDRRFARDGALAAQVSRLAKALAPDHDRLEMLRFSFGVTQTVLSAACRRLDLGQGARALLVVDAAQAARDSVVARAERLADVIAGADSLAAVLGPDGRVLGASGGFDALEPASAAIDALILDAERGRDAVLRRTIPLGPVARDAGIARVDAHGERLFLMVVGPEHPAERQVERPVERRAERASAPPPKPAKAVAPAVVAPVPPVAPVPEISPATPALRFLWRTDADGVFTHVSSELAKTVGQENVPGNDEPWRLLRHRLPFPDGEELSRALAAIATFNDVLVHWPVAGEGEAAGIRLSGVAEFARDRTFRGYRGFGLIDEADRVPVSASMVAEEVIASTSEPEPEQNAEASAEPVGDIDASARASIEGAPEAAVPSPPAEAGPTTAAVGPPAGQEARAPSVTPDAPPPANPAPASNVVRIPATPTRILPPRSLSGNEEDAFRRIAEALGARIAEPVPSPADIVLPTPVVSPPAAIRPDTAILDRLPVGIVVHRDGETLYANRALFELLGYASLDAFVAAGGIGAIFAEDERQRPAERASVDVLRADGSTIGVEARLHRVNWGDAAATMLALLRAAPASVPAEESLPSGLGPRVRELESILDTATDGILVIEGDGRIDGINRAAEALFGVEAADVSGRPFTDLLAEESRRAAVDYIDGLSANGVASVLNDGREVIGRVPRGGLIPLFMTIGRLGETGKYCAVLRDITHWKNIEEELVAARRAAEAANAQKSEFLARISHEIRTPLNAIIGFSEVMMEERFGPIGSDRYRSYLRDIHVSGEHLMSLINDLLDLSKVEAGKLDLSFEAVALNETIRETVALMQPQANRERVIIRTSLATGLPSVVADARSLRQILLNILSNAVKFTRAGGQVIVATALEDNGEVVVRIRDTGIGMSVEDIDTAMKPFRQVATSGRERDGTGLGLPLTKALVEANRASFAIDSIPNQGTLVRVTFPTTRVLAG